MLFSRSSLPLVALTSCISTVVAGPIHSSLSKRGKNVLIGYRYVSEDQAEEYNTYGRLTAVGSSSTQLGEGAYIYPSLNEFVVPEEYWQCTIFADHDKFRQAKKMYIPQTSNTFFSSRRLERYLSEAMMDATSTVLFSKIDGDPQEHIQMMLPPYYLERSPKFHGAFGEGDLGISVKCLPKG
ncbi:hypothetical protein DFH07DRAFT_954479 [Mycena maculata]|uniref:Uncharacterized protein n=1 Tax=Mycena maculata TaxID=230809 RepID=A0AAD7JNV9_9AGAR|nr:hypothetical protein DFH07DRAFT_954479 [Mycena maculata]